MHSNLDSSLNKNFKNEVKSIVAVQQGSKYGFVIEIHSSTGTFYCPVEAYRNKDMAIQLLRQRLR